MMEGVIFTMPEGIDSMRADKAIALETHLSRSMITEMFDAGNVLVNGKQVKRSEKVFSGDEIEAVFLDSVDERIEPEDIPLDIVFEDDYLVVLNKPAGLVVHPGAGNKNGTLVNGLVYTYPEITSVGQSHRPGIVHRLDSTTSGLLVVAKTQEVYERFVEMFATHDVNREYLALVWGKLETTSGVIDAPIGRSTTRVTKMCVRSDGKHARTHYAVKEYYEARDVTLLDVSLETGRTHQIRVHVMAISHPIVGDKTYGGYRQSIECPRPFLHAHTLSFVHPHTGSELSFSVPLPDDLVRVYEAVKSYE